MVQCDKKYKGISIGLSPLGRVSGDERKLIVWWCRSPALSVSEFQHGRLIGDECKVNTVWKMSVGRLRHCKFAGVSAGVFPA